MREKPLNTARLILYFYCCTYISSFGIKIINYLYYVSAQILMNSPKLGTVPAVVYIGAESFTELRNTSQ